MGCSGAPRVAFVAKSVVALGLGRHSTAVNVLIITAALSLRSGAAAIGGAIRGSGHAPGFLRCLGGCPCGRTPATSVKLGVPAGLRLVA